jgi:hypothetical protein
LFGLVGGGKKSSRKVEVAGVYLCREECYEKMIRSGKWRRAREWLGRETYKRVEGVEVQAFWVASEVPCWCVHL